MTKRPKAVGPDSPSDLTGVEFGVPTVLETFPHWQYFLAIEADLEATSRYVEFDRSNFSTYSIEFVRLLLATCSEIDVVAKLLCKRLEPRNKARKIAEYRSIILQHFPRFPEIRIVIPRFGLLREPWRAWLETDSPQWWAGHNKVKHERSQHYASANLEHSLDAVAGLWALLLYFYRSALQANLLEPLPRLLHLEREPAYLMLEQNYELPDP